MSSRISDMVVTEYLRSHHQSLLVNNTKTERVHLFRNDPSEGAPRCECGSAVFTPHMVILNEPPNDLYAVGFRWCYSCVSNGLQVMEEALERTIERMRVDRLPSLRPELERPGHLG